MVGIGARNSLAFAALAGVVHILHQHRCVARLDSIETTARLWNSFKYRDYRLHDSDGHRYFPNGAPQLLDPIRLRVWRHRNDWLWIGALHNVRTWTWAT